MVAGFSDVSPSTQTNFRLRHLSTYKKSITSQVIFKHALKNALNPVITAVSGWLASLMAGAFFVEYVFNWRGLGYAVIHAIETRDLPIVMGGAIIIAVIFVLINTFVDIIYAVLDPRVRLNN